jgi:hypothetical protein
MVEAYWHGPGMPSCFQFDEAWYHNSLSTCLDWLLRIDPRYQANRLQDDDDPNESRYLGQNSIAAFLSEETTAAQPSADGEQDVIRKDIMPILGLQVSSASYPFMSKEHMDKIRHDIASALPSDRDVLKLVASISTYTDDC